MDDPPPPPPPPPVSTPPGPAEEEEEPPLPPLAAPLPAAAELKAPWLLWQGVRGLVVLAGALLALAVVALLLLAVGFRLLPTWLGMVLAILLAGCGVGVAGGFMLSTDRLDQAAFALHEAQQREAALAEARANLPGHVIATL